MLALTCSDEWPQRAPCWADRPNTNPGTPYARFGEAVQSEQARACPMVCHPLRSRPPLQGTLSRPELGQPPDRQVLDFRGAGQAYWLQLGNPQLPSQELCPGITWEAGSQ